VRMHGLRAQMKQLMKTHSLRTKTVLVFLLVALLPLGFLMLWNLKTEQSLLTDEATNELVSYASHTANSINTFFKEELRTIRTVAQNPALARYLIHKREGRVSSQEQRDIESILQSLLRRDQVFIHSFHMLDATGINIIDTEFQLVGKDYSQESYFRRPLQTGIPFVSEVQITSLPDKEASLYFSSPVRDFQRHIVGFLVERYDAAILQKIITEHTRIAHAGAFALLLDQQLNRLADGRSPDMIFQKIPTLDDNALRQLQQLVQPRQNSRNGVLVPSQSALSAAEQKMVFRTRFSARDPQLNLAVAIRTNLQPWLVVFAKSEKAFLAPIRDQLLDQIYMGGVVLLLVILAALLAAQFLLRPIATLTEMANQVKAGNWQTSVQLDSKDELGILANTLNLMAARVHETMQGLEAEMTERKSVQMELQRLVTAIEQSAECIVITDTEGVIEYVNPAFVSVTGYSFTEAIGETCRILKSGKQSPEVYQELWGTIKQDKIWRGRLLNRKKDGTLYEQETTISPVFDTARRKMGFVAINRDITKQIKLEIQLRQSQKLEAIGQLAGGVAHDFNNLLQGIRGYTEMSLIDLPDQATAHEHLEQVIKAVERATSLVRQLLAFSRKQLLEMKCLNLNQVIADLLNLLRRLIGERIEVVFQSQSDLKTINADAGQLEQILVNLCINARDAMPKGGRISIRTGNVVLDSEFCQQHPWGREGEFILLTVEDNGSGISPEICERIFEPFFTTKEAGTGLGLATVYGIVKQHEGFITVNSETGQGTLFKIYLPVSECVVSATRPVPAETLVSGGDETVLLAEDDDLVRGMAIKVLEKAGYHLLVATDGEQAVNLFEQHGREIQLVVLDVVMPKLDGPAVFEQIRKKAADLPVLFCSGYNRNAGETFYNMPGTDLLQKPYPPKELLLKIRQMLSSGVRQSAPMA
jgi:PAS domain S-box-containing protein